MEGRKMKWISVEDRLPEIGTPVLCYDEHIYRHPIECNFDVCIYYGEYTHLAYDEKERKSVLQEGYRWPLFDRVDNRITRNYSHWMPLPEPPKED
jgi:hypothetical protein